MPLPLRPDQILPDDTGAVLVGRVWSASEGGPCPVLIRDGRVLNLISHAPTLSALLETAPLDPAAFAISQPFSCLRKSRPRLDSCSHPATCRRSRPPV